MEICVVDITSAAKAFPILTVLGHNARQKENVAVASGHHRAHRVLKPSEPGKLIQHVRMGGYRVNKKLRIDRIENEHDHVVLVTRNRVYSLASHNVTGKGRFRLGHFFFDSIHE